MNQYEKNILAHIEAHGCSVTSVFDPDREKPPFSYSIGIARSASAPAVAKVPPPGPSVPTKSVSQNWQIAEARSRSRPLQRLQPVNRKKTAGRP